MGWTVNQGRRRDRLRHRPHLEHLDDRCLLSTGLEGHLIHALPTLRERASGADPGRPSRSDAREGERPRGSPPWPGRRASRAACRDPDRDDERGGRLRHDHRRLEGPVELQRQRLGDDGGRDRHRRRLQQPRAGRRLRRRARRSSPDTISPTTRPIRWPSYSQHGTAVAGIIGSDDPSDPGVAPGVNIVALRVTDGTQHGQPHQHRQRPAVGRHQPRRSTTSPWSTCRCPTGRTTPTTGSRPRAARPSR